MLIALIVFGAFLFLFFELKPQSPKLTEVPASESTPAVSSPQAPSEKQTAQVETAAGEENHNSAKASSRESFSGTPVRIYFDFNKAAVNKNVYCIFDRIQSIVREKGPQSVRVVVEGNADSVGPSWYNNLLSRRRAARVADSLSRRLGIPVRMISIVANGATKPIASNKTRDGRADNRRTDVLIYF